MTDLVEEIHKACPPSDDPMLVNRTPENRRLPLAGMALHSAWVAYAMSFREEGEKEMWTDKKKAAWDTFIKEWTNR